ncbi:MAG: hypothetical protein JW878_10495 [Methanomicrobia archaeon]|nr:hypothetical protein [Methanomicrobia archaeon]
MNKPSEEDSEQRVNPSSEGEPDKAVKDPDKRSISKKVLAGAVIIAVVIGIGSVIYYNNLASEETPAHQQNPDSPLITESPPPTITSEPTPTITPEPIPTPGLYERPPEGVIPGNKAEIVDYSERAVELAYERLKYPAEDPRHVEAENIGRDWIHWAVQGVAERGFLEDDVVDLLNTLDGYLYDGCYEERKKKVDMEGSHKALAQDLKNDKKNAQQNLEGRCYVIFEVSPGARC